MRVLYLFTCWVICLFTCWVICPFTYTRMHAQPPRRSTSWFRLSSSGRSPLPPAPLSLRTLLGTNGRCVLAHTHALTMAPRSTRPTSSSRSSPFSELKSVRSSSVRDQDWGRERRARGPRLFRVVEDIRIPGS